MAPSVAGGAKTVALTFDDGPGASTAEILSILESFDVPATFFDIGVEETRWPDDVRAEAALGLLIGDHTWDHPDMVTLSAKAQAAEIDEAIAEQRSLVGSAPCVFRPPDGTFDATTLALASERHLAVWLWDVDTEDWQAEGSPSSFWVNRIVSLAESEGGALRHPVVVMHNQSISMPATLAALPTIITYFEREGYTFVDLLGRSGPPMSCGGEGAREAGTVVKAGSRLASGESVASPGGQFELVMRADGNLVMERVGGGSLWQSATAGSRGASAVMQPDGNFAVYSATGEVLWASDTERHPGARLDVQADGNVIVAKATGALWCAGSKDSELAAGTRLRAGWSLESPTWLSRLVMQADGNLVLYSIGGRVLWESRTEGHVGATAVMERDGNLVVQSRAGRTLWSSGTSTRGGAHLEVTGPGPVVVASSTGAVLWSSSSPGP